MSKADAKVSFGCPFALRRRPPQSGRRCQRTPFAPPGSLVHVEPKEPLLACVFVCFFLFFPGLSSLGDPLFVFLFQVQWSFAGESPLFGARIGLRTHEGGHNKARGRFMMFGQSGFDVMRSPFFGRPFRAQVFLSP